MFLSPGDERLLKTCLLEGSILFEDLADFKSLLLLSGPSSVEICKKRIKLSYLVDAKIRKCVANYKSPPSIPGVTLPGDHSLLTPVWAPGEDYPGIQI